jgi:hypothetical protein
VTLIETRTTTVTRDLTAFGRRLGVESTMRRLPAAAGIPPQLLVTERRPDPRASNSNDIATQWVLVSQRTREGWRTVYERGFDWAGFLRVWTGDLTGDDHADVLVASEEGSGGCGAHVAIATVRGRTSEIFRATRAKATLQFRAAASRSTNPWGPARIAAAEPTASAVVGRLSCAGPERGSSAIPRTSSARGRNSISTRGTSAAGLAASRRAPAVR